MDSDPDHDDWDHDWDDDPWVDDSWETADLDARLRDRVASGYPAGGDSYVALAELRPLIASARRRRRSMQGVMLSAAVVLAVVGGMLSAEKMIPVHKSSIEASSNDKADQSGVDGGSTKANGDAEEGIGRPKTATGPATTDAVAGADTTGPSTDTVATTAVAAGGAAPATPTYDGPGSGSAGPGDGAMVTVGPGGVSISPGSTTTRPSGATPTTSGTTRTSASTTSTTRSTTTTVPASGRVTLPSRCGSIDVLVGHSRVDLAAVNPNPGGRADIHDSGPTLVDVTLAYHGNECQITAQVRDGRLVTSPADD